MWGIFLFFLCGIILGFCLNKSKVLKFSEYAINLVVYFLLFLLGVNTGSSEKLVNDFLSIGFEAIIISSGAIFGSLFFAYLWEKTMCSGNNLKSRGDFGEVNGISITGSLNVTLFFIAGILIGFFFKNRFVFLLNGQLITCTLFSLLFFVGVSIGSDRPVLRNIKKMKAKTILFPLITISGTLAGSVVFSLFFKRLTFFDAMAVGSGFGYYSLSSVIIAELKGNRLATIGLIANIIREIFTILFAPLIYSIFGRFALISSGGATSMDTTLPVVLRFSGKESAIISVYHGIVLTILVPILVSFFLQL